VPLMVNAIEKADGPGSFEKKLLAETWEWTAKAQGLPLDKPNRLGEGPKAGARTPPR
jgi:hypothetical protein